MTLDQNILNAIIHQFMRYKKQFSFRALASKFDRKAQFLKHMSTKIL